MTSWPVTPRIVTPAPAFIAPRFALEVGLPFSDCDGLIAGRSYSNTLTAPAVNNTITAGASYSATLTAQPICKD